jgi:hypothetical protein
MIRNNLCNREFPDGSYIYPMRSIVLLLVVAAFGSNAQNMKLISGSLKPLKGLTSFDIRFRYDSMIVGTDTKERDYRKSKE